MRACKDMPYHIGIRVKLYPSDRQKKIIAVNTGAQRAVYNLFVATHQEIYRMRKASGCVPAYRDRIDYLDSRVSSTAEIRNALPYLSEPEIDCMVIANGHVNYRRAWKNAKEGRGGIPTFHKKQAEAYYQTNSIYKKESRCLNDGSVRFVDKRHVRLPKLGKIRFGGSPKILRFLLNHTENTRIGTITIGRDAVGEFWATFQISSEHPLRKPFSDSEKPKRSGRCGIDLNLHELVNVSHGQAFENQKFRKTSERKLKKVQRALSRRKRRAEKEGRRLSESKNYQKARKQYAYIHRMVKRQRKNYLNVVSCRLIKNHDLVAAENLQVKNMLKNHHLAAAISDAGWGTLLAMLQQKADMYGRTVVLVPPQYTTQTCSACGYVLKGSDRLPLSVREWTCPNCGTHHLRDHNAAKNILKKAEAMLASAEQ